MVVEGAELPEARGKQLVGRFALQPRLRDALAHELDGSEQCVGDGGQHPATFATSSHLASILRRAPRAA
jgi:hypothetical protein